MPITIKTSRDSERTKEDRWIDTTLGMVKAVAEAIGSGYKTVAASESNIQYFISAERIGFPGLGIFFESDSRTSTTGDDNIINCGVYDVSSDGISPDESKNHLKMMSSCKGSNMNNTLYYCPETCVMICDEAKDTVLFDIHPGSTLNGVDLGDFDASVSRRARTSFALFFAKDINGGVLCGIGNGHITNLRTLTSKLDNEEKPIRIPQMDFLNPNTLHLTKMVNYLDPSYPEMKSAYVSVIRPIETDQKKLYVSTLYACGKRWARAGLVDSWPSEFNTKNYPPSPPFYPIEPYVNY